MQSQRAAATKLGLVTLLVLSGAAPVSAEPITTFKSQYHFRQNAGPNSVGIPAGDRQFVGLLEVAPTAGTVVTATQGAVTRPLPATFSTIFPTTFRSLEPFDPSLTGAWSITATNGPDVAGPLLTLAIANPRLLPFAQNLQIVGTGPTPTVTWSFPDLTGIDLNYLRFRVYNDLNNDGILNVVLPRTATAFAIPAGVLFPGVPYIFSVYMQDMDGNVSTAYTQSAYFVPEPLQLLVSSELTDSVKRYDAVTGAYLGDFVSAGEQVEPRGLAFGPDGNVYVAGGGDGNRNVKRFDGRTGAFIETVTSGYPSRINGIAFGPDGYLYGAVFEDDSVFRVDVTTGTQVGEVGPGSPLAGPSGVAFGADGHLYVGSIYTGEVLRFDATTGAFIDVFATVPSGGAVNGVRFGPDGDLYVTVDYCGPAGCLSGDILRFDGTTGASKGSFIAPGDPHPVEPRSPIFGPDGDLYVSSHLTDQVLRYDGTSGAFLGSFVGGGLDGPTGLAVLPAPHAKPMDLLVSSFNSDNVKRYDGSTGAYLGDFVSGVSGQPKPRGLTFGPDRNLYVGSDNPNIKRFDGGTGAFIDTFTAGDPVLDMTFGPDGDLYASGFGSLQLVLRFDGTTGDLVGTLGAGSPLDRPAGLAFGADGNVYVGSGDTNQILRFNGTTGAFIDVFATIPISCPGTCPIDVNFGPDGNLYAGTNFAFGVPSDIWRFDGKTGASLGAFIPPADPHPEVGSLFAFGPDRNLYFTSFATNQVLRYDGTDGHYIDSFATGGDLDGPWGLAFVPAVLPVAPNDLLVASRANGRVIHYDGATGAPLGEFVTAGLGGLESPFGMTYGPDGNLYVANGAPSPGAPPPSSNSVLRYDGVSGNFIDEFCSGLPAPLTQISFGPDGHLYVSVGSANIVVRCDGTTGGWEPFAGPGSPLNSAAGLTFGPDGNLYVGSFQGSQVLRYDGATGAYIDAFATVPISGTDGYVGGVAFGPDGDLYVTLINTGNDIWRFDGTTGASKGSFIPPADPHPDGPVFMLFGPGNILYVSSRDADEVMRYNATTGAFIDHFATGGGLDSAAGIALPEPGVATQLGAGLALLVVLARHRYRGARRQTLPRA